MKDADRMIAEVRKLVQARGAKFLLAQLPTGTELRTKSVTLPAVRFGAFAARNQFPQHGVDAYFLSEEDGHLSPQGHSLVCDILHGQVLSQQSSNLSRAMVDKEGSS
jgi:hypothetical protein